jgi:CRISPR-associated endonuclease/helicase Cas3
VVAAGLDGAMHLTTRQTATDRRTLLGVIRQRLKDGAPCRLIATSLVEAGVDLDFPRVWRAEAGLDQIAQAGGRCNREGRRSVEQSIVAVFHPTEAKPPREIAGFIGDMERMKTKYGTDPLSPEAMHEYFGEVYWRKGEHGLDRIHAKSLDGTGTTRKVMEAFLMGSGATNFAYRSVGEGFRLIERERTRAGDRCERRRPHEDAQRFAGPPADARSGRTAASVLFGSGATKSAAKADREWACPVRRGFW